MIEDVKIEETELARQRWKAEQVDMQRLSAMAKVRDADELIKIIIRANSQSTKSKSALATKLELESEFFSSFDPLEILLLQQSEILLFQPS